jgi:hypothetical protein
MSTSSKEYESRINLFSKVNRTAIAFHNANPSLTDMTPIDLNDDEVISFLKDMQHEGIAYMLIGGFAMAFHGHIRATIDLDLWIKDEKENLEKFKGVLKRSGVVGLDKIRSLELIAGFTQFQLGDSGFVVDPMSRLKKFSTYDFDACYSRAQDGQYKGVSFKVISPRDLLQEKEATNRPKDQGDIEFLKGKI